MTDRYIPGVPCWADTTQPDPAAAATFYGELYGWQMEDVMPPDAPGRYLIGRLAGGDAGAVASAREGEPAVWNTYIWVDDADAAVARVRDAGGAVLAAPTEVGDAGRMAVCADPEGAVFSLWQARAHRGAAVVNEHGGVNFNDLKTRDAEGAARFYGAVFGWQLLPVGDALMWALPAYGDFLEQRTPGRRENMAAMGAPPRFDEVVASATPLRRAGALGRHLRRRRRRRDRRAGGRAGRRGARRAVRRAVGADDGHPRPAGRRVHGEPVRAGEQGPGGERRGGGRALASAPWAREPSTGPARSAGWT
jgi:predicted enzyme related to lactoylglutathione lyase